MTYFLGVDLGQAADYTAIAVLDRLLLPTPVLAGRGSTTSSLYLPSAKSPPSYRLDCRHLERLPLNTPYPEVVDRIGRLLTTPALQGDTQLVVDATGVGRPVVDLFRERDLEPVPITITGGDTVSYDQGLRVPKRDLVGAVAVLLQTDRLRIAEALPHARTLTDELLRFRVKIDPLTSHDSYGVWRDGAHDDLVLAVAVAAWWGLRWSPPARRRGLGTVCYSIGTRHVLPSPPVEEESPPKKAAVAEGSAG